MKIDWKIIFAASLSAIFIASTTKTTLAHNDAPWSQMEKSLNQLAQAETTTATPGEPEGIYGGSGSMYGTSGREPLTWKTPAAPMLQNPAPRSMTQEEFNQSTSGERPTAYQSPQPQPQPSSNQPRLLPGEQPASYPQQSLPVQTSPPHVQPAKHPTGNTVRGYW